MEGGVMEHPGPPGPPRISSEAPLGNSMESRLSKERRRRERRERRARRAARSSLVNQMEGFMYEGMGNMPDLLQQHLPPPAYTTLPGRGRPEVGRREGAWRAGLPGLTRPGRCAEDGLVPGQTLLQPEPESKGCCGVAVSQTVSIRWFIVMIAFVGICCSVVGTVLGAMKASGREHLTVSLLMIGVGIVLITVSGIAWRLTSQDAPSCRAMLGLGLPEGDGRFLPAHQGFPRPQGHLHPYAGMMYSDFQYRPPPPSYQASMQEYRLRLLLMDRSGGPPPLPPALSPPPAYRGPPAPLHGSVSRPPSYHSRAGSSILPLHARHPSQLSKLSFAGAPTEASLQEEPKHCPVHVTQVPVVPATHKASIRIQGSHDMEQYITNIQEQFGRLEGEKTKRERKDSEVTIVQNTSMELHQPVVVTVSGSLDVAESNSTADCDVLAHL